jgi:molybdopterin molybdotransferase
VIKKGDTKMIDVKDALKAVLEHTPLLPSETILLHKALHSVLAETITARDDIPLFDSSAMDGYGVKVNDIESASDKRPVALKIVGIVRAGQVYEKPMEHGTAVKIFTGAMVPEGVEAVLIKENASEIDGKVLAKSPVKTGENIRRRGEEFLRGDEALSPGVLITPPVIGLLAGLGYAKVRVHRKPKVAVVITGDELIDPEKPLKEGKIRDVNSFTLQAALEELGVEMASLKRTSDNPEKLLETVHQSLQSADVLIISGGVSVGDFDFVREVSERAGIEKVFWKVAVKPGKPIFFGTKGAKNNGQLRLTENLVFGLPGNPASVLVTFYLFVRPALLRMMGRKETQLTSLPALMESNVQKKNGRAEYLRGKLQSQNGSVCVGFHGEQHSHMLSSFANADCLAVFPKEQMCITKGEKVQIQLLPWAAL